jgi:hypothetical protein
MGPTFIYTAAAASMVRSRDDQTFTDEFANAGTARSSVNLFRTISVWMMTIMTTTTMMEIII